MWAEKGDVLRKLTEESAEHTREVAALNALLQRDGRRAAKLTAALSAAEATAEGVVAEQAAMRLEVLSPLSVDAACRRAVSVASHCCLATHCLRGKRRLVQRGQCACSGGACGTRQKRCAARRAPRRHSPLASKRSSRSRRQRAKPPMSVQHGSTPALKVLAWISSWCASLCSCFASVLPSAKQAIKR